MHLEALKAIQADSEIFVDYGSCTYAAFAPRARVCGGALLAVKAVLREYWNKDDYDEFRGAHGVEKQSKPPKKMRKTGSGAEQGQKKDRRSSGSSAAAPAPNHNALAEVLRDVLKVNSAFVQY